MSRRGPQRVVVLAEPETFFLPNCLARLAQLHPLVAIVEVPAPPMKAAVGRARNAFGLAGVASIAAAEVAARVVDRVSPDRFYSLRKVARRLGIPYRKVSGLHSPDCVEAIESYRPDVVFAQVSRRIRPELLERATFWNKHCSLLPGYAGVFPVFWGLLDGQPELGVTVHEMDEEFDRGTILQQARTRADGHTFFGAYHALYDLSAPLLDRALRGDVVSADDLQPKPTPSYRSFPTPAERAAFRSRGLRLGTPFRLHPAVALERRSEASAERRAVAGLSE
jgi:methionyl-tRNA formyltransferase